MRHCAYPQRPTRSLDELSGRDALSRLRRIDPALRVSNLGDITPLRRPEDIARYAEAMRKAGLPE